MRNRIITIVVCVLIAGGLIYHVSAIPASASLENADFKSGYNIELLSQSIQSGQLAFIEIIWAAFSIFVAFVYIFDYKEGEMGWTVN